MLQSAAILSLFYRYCHIFALLNLKNCALFAFCKQILGIISEIFNHNFHQFFKTQHLENAGGKAHYIMIWQKILKKSQKSVYRTPTYKYNICKISKHNGKRLLWENSKNVRVAI